MGEIPYIADFDEIPDNLLPAKEELSRDMQIVAEIVGVRNTLKLAQVFQGTYVYFRNFNKLRQKNRNKAIRAASDRGKSVTAIAREFNLCERRIWDILKQDA